MAKKQQRQAEGHGGKQPIAQQILPSPAAEGHEEGQQHHLIGIVAQPLRQRLSCLPAVQLLQKILHQRHPRGIGGVLGIGAGGRAEGIQIA